MNSTVCAGVRHFSRPPPPAWPMPGVPRLSEGRPSAPIPSGKLVLALAGSKAMPLSIPDFPAQVPRICAIFSASVMRAIRSATRAGIGARASL